MKEESDFKAKPGKIIHRSSKKGTLRQLLKMLKKKKRSNHIYVIFLDSGDG